MQNYITKQNKKQQQKNPTKNPSSNCYMVLLSEQNPKPGRASNCPSAIQGLYKGPEDAERDRLSWREHMVASCKMPEKRGWIRYGRDVEKCTTDRIMKNYAKIQNNEIAWYVHDKKGDRLYKRTERTQMSSYMLSVLKVNLANSFLKLPGLSTSCTATHRME